MDSPLADVVNLALDRRSFRVRHWRISRRLLKMRCAASGNHQRLLFTQRVSEQTKRADLAGGVHPYFFFAQRKQRNDVIELRRRWNIHIELVRRIDQHRRSVKAFCFEERLKQSALIFAVAILIVQHIGSGMRLVAAEAEREADVTEVERDKVVERFNFVDVDGTAFGQFFRLRQ